MSWDYGCEHTGKRRYPTAADVRDAIKAVGKRGAPQRPYRCKHCHGWHLTHFLHETRPKRRARTLYPSRKAP